MIRKIGILGLGLCSLLSLISCEEDFKDIGGNVIKNTAFTSCFMVNELNMQVIDEICYWKTDFSGETLT